jgi:exodeoxyribonuclease V alpha subunit
LVRNKADMNLVSQLFAKALLGENFGSGHVPSLAQRIWQCSLDGDACMVLNEAELVLLKSDACSKVVGPDKPLVIEDNALYLHRFWSAEKRVAAAVLARLAQEPSSMPAAQNLPEGYTTKRLKEALPEGLAPEQEQAIQVALQAKLSVIHGGPGTGKTRTLASLMACYAQFFQRPLWVAAPTAKAGARLMESLRDALTAFESNDPSAATLDAASFAFLPKEAYTIQRLLRSLSPADLLCRDTRNAEPDHEQPGLLVIDEASMLSLELCDQIFARLDRGCLLVLVGDPNQLHSVETGSVFASLCLAQHLALDAVRVKLTRNFRQSEQAHLNGLASAILDGQMSAHLFAAEVGLADQNLAQLVEGAARHYSLAITQAQAQYSVRTYLKERAKAYLEQARRYRLLSARRTGFAGADRLSSAVLHALRKEHRLAEWFEGRLVTIVKNDYASGLFNGDLGVCVHPSALDVQADEGLPSEPMLIAFERSGEVLLLRTADLPEFQDAYCLSVHQSQGSEFDQVDFLAAPAEHPLATRELLYTAVTRAKKRLMVFAQLADLNWAATHPTVRTSRLQWRLEQDPHPLV